MSDENTKVIPPETDIEYNNDLQTQTEAEAQTKDAAQTEAEAQTQTQSKKKSGHIFRRVYLGIMIVLLVLWGLGLSRMNTLLQQYELSQPQYAMDDIVRELQQGDFEKYLYLTTDLNRYESAEEIQNRFIAKIKDRDFTYKQIGDNLELKQLTYALYADREKIAEIVLEGKNEKSTLWFLSTEEWSFLFSRPCFTDHNIVLKLSVPDIYQVYINDIPLDGKDGLLSTEELELFRYVKEYVAVPQIVKYELDGFLYPPVVRICDANGNEIPFTTKQPQDAVTEITVTGFTGQEMPSELEKMVMENAIRYSNYFTRDLPDATKSVAPIADLFPEDSYFLTLADEYRRRDMWMFNAHKEPQFYNKQVSNYVRYSEDLFSCEVFFDKEMFLTKTKTIRKDSVHTRYMYGLLDGRWKICDIVTLFDE